MNKIVLYTMNGCPWCVQMKDLLKESKIKYVERDIDKHKDEYDLFVEATGNDFVPAFLVLKLDENSEVLEHNFLNPDKDFQTLEEAIEKIKGLI